MTIFTKQNLNPIFDITFMRISLFQVYMFRSIFLHLISLEISIR